MFTIVCLIAAAGFHIANNYVPISLISVIIAAVVLNSVLMVACALIIKLRDSAQDRS